MFDNARSDKDFLMISLPSHFRNTLTMQKSKLKTQNIICAIFTKLKQTSHQQSAAFTLADLRHQTLTQTFDIRGFFW